MDYGYKEFPPKSAADRPSGATEARMDVREEDIQSMLRGGSAMDNEDANVRQLIGEITALVTAFPSALERRAGEIEARGEDPDVAAKLLKGADVMRDSGHMYVTWARHYVDLSQGKAVGTEDVGKAEFSV